MRRTFNLVLSPKKETQESELTESQISFLKFDSKSSYHQPSEGQITLRSVHRLPSQKNLRQPSQIKRILSHDLRKSPSQSELFKSEPKLKFKMKQKPPKKQICEKIQEQRQKLKEMFHLVEKTLRDLRQSLVQIRKFIYEDLSYTVEKVASVFGQKIDLNCTQFLSRIKKIQRSPSIETEIEKIRKSTAFPTIPVLHPKQSLLRNSRMLDFHDSEDSEGHCVEEVSSEQSHEIISTAKKYIDSIKAITKKISLTKFSKSRNKIKSEQQTKQWSNNKDSSTISNFQAVE